MDDTSPLLPWWSRIWFNVQRWSSRRRCSGNDGSMVVCSWWFDGAWCCGGCALQRRWRSGGCRQWWNLNCHGWCAKKLRGGCEFFFFFLNIESMASVFLHPRQKRNLWFRVMAEAKRECLMASP